MSPASTAPPSRWCSRRAAPRWASARPRRRASWPPGPTLRPSAMRRPSWSGAWSTRRQAGPPDPAAERHRPAHRADGWPRGRAEGAGRAGHAGLAGRPARQHLAGMAEAVGDTGHAADMVAVEGLVEPAANTAANARSGRQPDDPAHLPGAQHRAAARPRDGGPQDEVPQVTVGLARAPAGGARQSEEPNAVAYQRGAARPAQPGAKQGRH